MTTGASRSRPPRVAAWLVELFASTQEADGILGDLAEEFTAHERVEGTRDARRAYWRHARHTMWDLAWSPLGSPGTSGARVTATGLVVAAGIGFLAHSMATGIVWPVGHVLVMHGIYKVFPAFQWWEDHMAAPFAVGTAIALISRAFGVRAMGALFVNVALSVGLAAWLQRMSFRNVPSLGPVALFASLLFRLLQNISLNVIGAIIGRLMPFPDRLLRRQPATQ
jgi:hypothetical protein